MLRIKFFPQIDYFAEFLQKKNLIVGKDRPNVLHYFGSDLKELKGLIKKEKPDFLITHKIKTFKVFDVPQAFHLLNSKLDLARGKKIYTTSLGLCNLYYQKLGLPVEIIEVPSPFVKKRKAVWEVNFLILDRFKRLLSRFQRFMLWV